MTEITLIFPDQLFLAHPAITKERSVYLVEEFLFFKVQLFHKQRLVLLRASMKRYAEILRKNGIKVFYIPSKELERRGALIDLLAKKMIKTIHLAEFADEWLHHDLKEGKEKHRWDIHFYTSPGFINSNQSLNDFFSGKERYSMAQFYAYQRKSQNILMCGKSPIGGKYSFDTENRRKIPKGLPIPPPFIPPRSRLIDEVIAEIEQEFPQAIGETSPFIYPTCHKEAKEALQYFLHHKLQLFGNYQDAVQSEDPFLFHSVLSPLINTGLLTPMEVVSEAVLFAEKKSIPMNSLEGFIRQIIGWREFVRASYLYRGSMQRSMNFFQHHEKIPKKFWYGTTGIISIDSIVKTILRTGYCNHIERLMVLGNFLLLTETSPDDVYHWFMAYFVDAYDWVMVPNVYGMSQYADGGGIVTKPYISSSNYILKMSNYPKGEWTTIWDGLFWRFLQKHRDLFSSNYRTQTLMQMLNKNKESITSKINKAELWLKEYRQL